MRPFQTVLLFAMGLFCALGFAESHKVPEDWNNTPYRPATAGRTCIQCQYMEFSPACVQEHTQNKCESRKTLGEVADCLWLGGVCMTRFQNYCNKWVSGLAETLRKDGHPNVHSSITFDDKHSGAWTFAEKGQLEDCDVTYYKYMGHGRGLYDYLARVESLVDHAKLKSGPQTLVIDDIGCSTFEDVFSKRSKLDYIARELPKGMTVILSANQTEVNPEVRNAYGFRLSSTGVQDLAPGKCRESETCYVESEKAICSTSKGMTREVCCKSRWTGALQWRVGVLSCKD